MLILGFQFGITGKTGKSNMLVVCSLALTLAAVIWLILVLDNPKLGLITLNQQQIVDLQTEMKTATVHQ